MSESNEILRNVKDTIGIIGEAFDNELLIRINSEIASLYQLGIEEFEDLVVIHTTTWPIVSYTSHLQNLYKSYLTMKVRLSFDPPASPTVLESLKGHCSETESRIMVAAAEYEASL